MSGHRTAAAILGATVVAIALVGCSSESLLPLAGARAAVTASTSSAEATMPSATVPVPRSSLTPTVATPPAPANQPTPAPTKPASTVCEGSPSGIKHIYVSISKQLLWACTGPVLFASTLVTTGASALTNVHDATPYGTWRIYSKVRNTVLVGHDANGSWRDSVAYWMPFWEGYGFHDASWQKFPFGSPLYKTKGSHGCVHVPVKVLGKLFNWAPIGTLVTIRG